jgi:hypothetical protein
MRYVTSRLLILVSIPVALAQTACSLSSRSSHHVVISMPEGGFKASMIRTQSMARVQSGSGGGSNFPMPSSLADFKCIGVMVTGDGILPDPAFNSECKANPNVMTRGLGKLVGLVPASGGSVDIQIPGGPARMIQLIGVQSGGECPDVVAALNSAGTEAGQHMDLGEPFEIGRVEQIDIFADQTIEIKAIFDPLKAEPMFGCHDDGGSGGSSGPVAFSDLDLFPHGPTSSDTVRVVGSLQGNAGQINLFGDAACTTLLQSNGAFYRSGKFEATATVPAGTGTLNLYVQAGTSPCVPVPTPLMRDNTAPSVRFNSVYPGMEISSTMSEIAVDGVCAPAYNGSVQLEVNGTAIGSPCSCTGSGFACAAFQTSLLPEGPVLLVAKMIRTSPAGMSDDAVLLLKDSLAPGVTVGYPAQGAPVTAGNQSAFAMSGSCGAPSYPVEIFAYFNNTEIALGTVPCTSSAWSASVDLSALPVGMSHLSVRHAGPSGVAHMSFSGISVSKSPP